MHPLMLAFVVIVHMRDPSDGDTVTRRFTVDVQCRFGTTPQQARNVARVTALAQLEAEEAAAPEYPNPYKVARVTVRESCAMHLGTVVA